jgi:hypothetical protein
MKAEEFDRKFDEGEEDIIQYLDLAQMKRPGLAQQPLNINFPVWMIEAVDKEAQRLGITRESVIKAWIADAINKAGTSERSPHPL